MSPLSALPPRGPTASPAASRGSPPHRGAPRLPFGLNALEIPGVARGNTGCGGRFAQQGNQCQAKTVVGGERPPRVGDPAAESRPGGSYSPWAGATRGGTCSGRGMKRGWQEYEGVAIVLPGGIFPLTTCMLAERIRRVVRDHTTADQEHTWRRAGWAGPSALRRRDAPEGNHIDPPAKGTL
jgi:hypothetical protein